MVAITDEKEESKSFIKPIVEVENEKISEAAPAFELPKQAVLQQVVPVIDLLVDRSDHTTPSKQESITENNKGAN